MTRLLIILALIVLAVFVLRRAFFPKNPTQNPSDAPGKTADMVRCDLCGLHVPRAEAIVRDNRHYCCEDHAKRAGH